MLEWRWGDTAFRLSILFPAALIVMLSLDNSGITELCLTASLIHELGHGVMMLLCRDRPARVTLDVFGMCIERRPTMRLGYTALCAVSLAGPLANALCAVWMPPQAALVHGVLAVFHLLPIASLDGGEALYALLCRRLAEQRAEQVLHVVSVSVLLPLTAFALWLCVTHGNFTLPVVCLYLILRMFLRQGH